MADRPGARSVAVMSSEEPTLIVHVRCGPHGEWFIQEGSDGDPLSWHGSETEAEQEAVKHLHRRGGKHKNKRDSYHRVHPSTLHAHAR